jgi:ribonuclease HI
MLYLYCDGAIEPKNPGGHAVGGWVLKDSDFNWLGEGARSYGTGPDVTNNIAEYGAVIAGLETLLANGYALRGHIRVRSDSQLIIRQLRNEYACKQQMLRTLRDKVFNLVEQFEGDIDFEWVPREENTDADSMSRALYVYVNKTLDHVLPEEIVRFKGQ